MLILVYAMTLRILQVSARNLTRGGHLTKLPLNQFLFIPFKIHHKLSGTLPAIITMAPLSVFDDVNQVPLGGTDTWIDGVPLPSIDNSQHVICSNDSLEPRRVPMAPAPYSPSILRTSKTIKITRTSGTERGRRITFNSSFKVHEIPCLDSLTDEEHAGTWWTPNEYMLIRKICKITLQLMARGEQFDLDDDDFCARGLEIRTRSGAEQHYRRRKRVLEAVLRAQEFQQYEGFEDQEYLAELCSEHSRSSARDAYNLAMADSQAVA